MQNRNTTNETKTDLQKEISEPVVASHAKAEAWHSRFFKERKTKANYKTLKELRKEMLENEDNEALLSDYYKLLLMHTILGDGMYAAKATHMMFEGMNDAWKQQYKDYPFGRYHPDAIPHQEAYIKHATEKNRLFGSYYACEFYLDYYRNVCGKGTYSETNMLGPIAEKFMDNYTIFQQEIKNHPMTYRKLTKETQRIVFNTKEAVKHKLADNMLSDADRTKSQNFLNNLDKVSSPLENLKLQIAATEIDVLYQLYIEEKIPKFSWNAFGLE